MRYRLQLCWREPLKWLWETELRGIWKMKECLESGLNHELTYFLNT